MAKIIGVFDSLPAAQAAAEQLGAGVVPMKALSIIGYATQGKNKIGVISAKTGKRPYSLKKSAAWGGALGLATTFLLPGGGQVFVAGHLLRVALQIKAAGLFVGAVAVSTTDLLRKAGFTRRAAQEAASIVAEGRFALALQSDWITTQRARLALGEKQWQPDARLVSCVMRYGYEQQSFVSLYGGMEVWFSQAPEAAVVYRRLGKVAVVSAAPLAAAEHLAEVTRQFLAYCQAEKMDCLMVPVGPEFARIAEGCGMGLLGIGESGYFQLPEWKPRGDKCKKVRAGVNQARGAGVEVERYDPGRKLNCQLRNEIEQLCQAWIGTREVDALGWLLELDPFFLSEHKRYFLARRNGKVEGLLACSPIPARNGWYLEDLIRHPQSERGVSELLVVTALDHLGAEGATLATLGTSPLAGIKTGGQFKQLSRVLKFIYENLDGFYHFKDLHHFKAKFAPSLVEPEYLA
ncbi:MAG: DUF2156 domain-containing protein, partial [Blastocatellia bacterium]